VVHVPKKNKALSSNPNTVKKSQTKPNNDPYPGSRDSVKKKKKRRLKLCPLRIFRVANTSISKVDDLKNTEVFRFLFQLCYIT
jgi:hypothetical protein